MARQLGESSLMLLVHPTLTAVEIDKTARVLTDVLAQAQGLARGVAAATA